jgi:hypothetical protein
MTIASVLFGLFGLAVVCALGAIAAYTVEMVIGGPALGRRSRTAAVRQSKTRLWKEPKRTSWPKKTAVGRRHG